MARKRHLLLVAALDSERKRSLAVMANAADLELAAFPSLPAGLQWLENNAPHVVAFDTGLPKSEKLCERVRSRRTLASVPIIGLAPELNDALTAKLFAMGVDDVIPALSSAALMTRLRLVPSEVSLIPPPDRGLAVVADAERARCDVFGRVLLNAGYEVKHAYDESALRYYATKPDVRVIVANSEISPPQALIEEGRQRGSAAVWIVTAQRRDVASLSEALESVSGACVLGVYSPPENLLFASNELLGKTELHSRESPRVLYGTVVAFRDAGGAVDQFGFCYNVSRGGLYVRTLAPPEAETVWLELRPPRTKQCVRLEGNVAWRRAFGPAAMATVPPGFGVEIVDWLGNSLSLWQEGYSSLAQVPGDSAPNLGAAAAIVREAEAARARPPPPPVRARNPADFAPPVSMRQSSVSAAAVLIAEIEEGDVVESLPAGAAAVAPPGVVEAKPPTVEPPPQELTPVAPPPPAPTVSPSAVVESAALRQTEPDSLPTVTSPPEVTRMRSARVTGVVVLGALLAGAVGVLSWAALRGPAKKAEPNEPPAISTPALAVPAASAVPVAPPAISAVEPVPARSAAPPTASAAVKEEPAIDMSGGDGTDLAHNQGYLVVRSSADADVYATGFKVGKTNAKNRSPCQLRWVRLGQGDPPRWISPGVTTMVKCREVTQMKLEPAEPVSAARRRER